MMKNEEFVVMQTINENSNQMVQANSSDLYEAASCLLLNDSQQNKQTQQSHVIRIR